MRAAKVAESCDNVTCYYVGDGPPMFVQSSQFDMFALSVLKKDRLQKVIRSLDPITDIFQVHTRPNHLVEWVREATDKPVVWDCHDLFGLFDKSVVHEESIAAKSCNGIVSVNSYLAHAAFTAVNYPKESDLKFPVSYYRTMLPKGWFPRLEDPEENHIIIPTGLSMTPGHFRYWYEVFKKIHALGIKLHVYSSQYKPVPEYVDIGIDCHGATPLVYLLGAITKAEAGLCGFPIENNLTKIASPNKFYEYIGCGIPIICYGEGLMADEVREKNLGVVVKEAEEIPEALKKIRKEKIRNHIREIRFQYSMETQIERLMKFYHEVISCGGS